VALGIEVQDDVYVGFRNVVPPSNGAEQKGVTNPSRFESLPNLAKTLDRYVSRCLSGGKWLLRHAYSIRAWPRAGPCTLIKAPDLFAQLLRLGRRVVPIPVIPGGVTH
jgi:hypothetical protein